jgi:hypothetical protein
VTLQEKILYHQIHLAKLLTDWATGFLALYFFWQKALLTGLLVAIVPPPSSPAFSSASRISKSTPDQRAAGSRNSI